MLIAALPLAVIAICGSMTEEIANNWAALAAAQISHVPAASVGLVFSVIIGSQCVGRFTGDLLIHKQGRAWVARLGGVLITVGGITIISAQEPVQLLIGLAAVGYGSAMLVPSALGTAARIPGIAPEPGLTPVNWIMRVGFLITSPAVGLITTAVNLRWGLTILPVIGVAAFFLARNLATANHDVTRKENPS